MSDLGSAIAKYLDYLPHDVRHVIEELSSKLVLNTESVPPTLSLGDASVMIPQDYSLVNYSVELLLRRAGYDGVLKDRFPMVVTYLTQAVRDVLDSVGVKPPALPLEVRHVSEREEIYYGIVKEVLSKFTIKTFYVTTSNSQYVLGIYCFDGVAYRPCEAEVVREIQSLVKHNEDLDKKVVRWVVSEALAKIRNSTLTPLKYEPMIIGFKNVLLDWEAFIGTGKLRESVMRPDPDIIVFHKVPHKLRIDRLESLEGLLKFDEGLVGSIEELARRLCPKSLEAFRAWVGEKWVLLFEIIGYTLYPKYDLHKAVMLVGEGRNGKSTYLRLIKDILGSWNVSNVSLQDLCDESKRFVLANLYHKLANIYADLPPRAIQYTGRFKVLTGEDSVTADRKFRDPITFTNYAKLIFSTNELPAVRDMTPAFWRRWLVIEFPNQFPPNPTFYEETFTEEEKEGVIIVSLLAFRNVLMRRKFSFEGTEADYKELWLRETNTVYAFIKDLLNGEIEGYEAERNPNARIESEKLYELYVKYCNAIDKEPLTKRNFTIEMQRQGFRRVLIKGKPYFKGLTIKPTTQKELQ